jgi:hypothetical protein
MRLLLSAPPVAHRRPTALHSGRISGWSTARRVARDKLIGNVLQVIADDLRPRIDFLGHRRRHI